MDNLEPRGHTASPALGNEATRQDEPDSQESNLAEDDEAARAIRDALAAAIDGASPHVRHFQAELCDSGALRQLYNLAIARRPLAFEALRLLAYRNRIVVQQLANMGAIELLEQVLVREAHSGAASGPLQAAALQLLTSLLAFNLEIHSIVMRTKLVRRLVQLCRLGQCDGSQPLQQARLSDQHAAGQLLGGAAAAGHESSEEEELRSDQKQEEEAEEGEGEAEEEGEGEGRRQHETPSSSPRCAAAAGSAGDAGEANGHGAAATAAPAAAAAGGGAASGSTPAGDPQSGVGAGIKPLSPPGPGPGPPVSPAFSPAGSAHPDAPVILSIEQQSMAACAAVALRNLCHQVANHPGLLSAGAALELAAVMQREADPYRRINTTMAVALLVGHEEQHPLMRMDEAGIREMLMVLACSRARVMCHGYFWTCWKVCQALARLSANEDNKQVLTREGGVEVLADVLLSDEHSRKAITVKYCVEALWNLAFYEPARQQILSSPALLDAIRAARQSGLDLVREVARGCLFTLGITDVGVRRSTGQECQVLPEERGPGDQAGFRLGAAAAAVSQAQASALPLQPEAPSSSVCGKPGGFSSVPVPVPAAAAGLVRRAGGGSSGGSSLQHSSSMDRRPSAAVTVGSCVVAAQHHLRNVDVCAAEDTWHLPASSPRHAPASVQEGAQPPSHGHGPGHGPGHEPAPAPPAFMRSNSGTWSRRRSVSSQHAQQIPESPDILSRGGASGGAGAPVFQQHHLSYSRSFGADQNGHAPVLGGVPPSSVSPFGDGTATGPWHGTATGSGSAAAVAAAAPASHAGSGPGGGEPGHIMISYEWGSQQKALMIKEALERRGLVTWMDVEKMSGSTLEAMALAVEGAVAVLLCITKRYKESQACRAEAEYAYQQRKRIIPIMMERGYRPTGWLGILIGTKLYFDCSERRLITERVASLERELGPLARLCRRPGSASISAGTGSRSRPASAQVAMSTTSSHHTHQPHHHHHHHNHHHSHQAGSRGFQLPSRPSSALASFATRRSMDLPSPALSHHLRQTFSSRGGDAPYTAADTGFVAGAGPDVPPPPASDFGGGGTPAGHDGHEAVRYPRLSFSSFNHVDDARASGGGGGGSVLSGVDECAGECAGVGVGVASGTAPSQHVVSLLLDSANPAMSQMDDLESEASALGGTAGLMDEAGPLALPPLPPLHPHRHPRAQPSEPGAALEDGIGIRTALQQQALRPRLGSAAGTDSSTPPSLASDTVGPVGHEVGVGVAARASLPGSGEGSALSSKPPTSSLVQQHQQPQPHLHHSNGPQASGPPYSHAVSHFHPEWRQRRSMEGGARGSAAKALLLALAGAGVGAAAGPGPPQAPSEAPGQPADGQQGRRGSCSSPPPPLPLPCGLELHEKVPGGALARPLSPEGQSGTPVRRDPLQEPRDSHPSGHARNGRDHHNQHHHNHSHFQDHRRRHYQPANARVAEQRSLPSGPLRSDQEDQDSMPNLYDSSGPASHAAYECSPLLSVIHAVLPPPPSSECGSETRSAGGGLPEATTGRSRDLTGAAWTAQPEQRLRHAETSQSLAMNSEYTASLFGGGAGAPSEADSGTAAAADEPSPSPPQLLSREASSLQGAANGGSPLDNQRQDASRAAGAQATEAVAAAAAATSAAVATPGSASGAGGLVVTKPERATGKRRSNGHAVGGEGGEDRRTRCSLATVRSLRREGDGDGLRGGGSGGVLRSISGGRLESIDGEAASTDGGQGSATPQPGGSTGDLLGLPWGDSAAEQFVQALHVCSPDQCSSDHHEEREQLSPAPASQQQGQGHGQSNHRLCEITCMCPQDEAREARGVQCGQGTPARHAAASDQVVVVGGGAATTACAGASGAAATSPDSAGDCARAVQECSEQHHHCQHRQHHQHHQDHQPAVPEEASIAAAAAAPVRNPFMSLRRPVAAALVSATVAMAPPSDGSGSGSVLVPRSCPGVLDRSDTVTATPISFTHGHDHQDTLSCLVGVSSCGQIEAFGSPVVSTMPVHHTGGGAVARAATSPLSPRSAASTAAAAAAVAATTSSGGGAGSSALEGPSAAAAPIAPAAPSALSAMRWKALNWASRRTAADAAAAAAHAAVANSGRTGPSGGSSSAGGAEATSAAGAPAQSGVDGDADDLVGERLAMLLAGRSSRMQQGGPAKGKAARAEDDDHGRGYGSLGRVCAAQLLDHGQGQGGCGHQAAAKAAARAGEGCEQGEWLCEDEDEVSDADVCLEEALFSGGLRYRGGSVGVLSAPRLDRVASRRSADPMVGARTGWAGGSGGGGFSGAAGGEAADGGWRRPTGDSGWGHWGHGEGGGDGFMPGGWTRHFGIAAEDEDGEEGRQAVEGMTLCRGEYGGEGDAEGDEDGVMMSGNVGRSSAGADVEAELAIPSSSTCQLVEIWKAPQVRDWLVRIGHGGLADRFEKAEITGRALCGLMRVMRGGGGAAVVRDMLRHELGVTGLAAQLELLEELHRLFD